MTQIEPLGDSALIVRPPDLAGIRAALEQLRAAQIRGVIELAPAATTIAVFYDPTLIGFHELERALTVVLSRRAQRQRTTKTRTVEIVVCYAAEFAPDLASVAEHAGIDVANVIQRHAAAVYRVSCIGFTPGFPYLSGLPDELATPRRTTPRQQVAAGAVAIGGAQTGIYPAASPGGWNIIGRTPLRLFDVKRQPPALLRAGDAVRFRAISRAEFDALNV